MPSRCLGRVERRASTKRKTRGTTNGRGEARPRRGEAVRQAELLGIAADLFADRGYVATTVRDIADEAGILSGSLYHHFDSKESMVDEILSSFQRDLFRTYDEIVASDRDPRAKLEAVG